MHVSGRYWQSIAPECLGYWTTRGYLNSQIAKSRTSQLALVKSLNGRLVDWTASAEVFKLFHATNPQIMP